MDDNNSCCSRVDNCCSEDSGWTMYIDDFDNDFHLKDNLGSGHGTSSVVSDAACSAVRDVVDVNLRRGSTSLIMEKKRRKAAVVDQDLEDTASSPSHSPKLVCDMNQLYKNSNGLDSRDVSQAYTSNNLVNNQHIYGHQPSYSKEKVRNSEEGVGINMDCMETQLRRQGLCVVPMSMLLGHIS